MTELVPCPFCETVNRPEQERCRACGKSLRASTGPAASVGLQRVMSGEVFTTVLGTNPRTPSPESSVPPQPAAAAPSEDTTAENTLATITERLRYRANSSGQRFKPYSGERLRKPETPEAKNTVVRQLESATRAFREKRYENAIEHLLKAIAKDDGDPRSWALLGETYLRCERPYKASVGYLRALELQPRNGNAWLGLSRALKAIGDLAGAREVLDRTVRVNPKLTEAWSERGQVLEALSERTEAAKSFAKALELRPDHRTARERYDRLAPEEVAPEEEEAPPVVAEPLAEPVPGPAPMVSVEPASEPEEDFPDFADLAELPAKESPAPLTNEAPKGHPARVRTYLEGLDEMIAGGVPWGHVVLIEGSPGTMKSSVAFSILLHNAARDGLHCLYLSLEERTSSLLKQMGSLGLHLHVNKGSLVVLDPRAAKGLLSDKPDWVDALQGAITAIKSERGLDLLVVDSLEALEVLAKFKDRRREIFRLFEWLRDLDVTSFVVTERPDWVLGGHVIQGRWDEDFLADGVIHLRQHLISDLEVQRRLRVVKLRGTRHDTGYMALVLDDGRFKVTRAMSP